MRNWLLVNTPDDFETSRSRGFEMAAMGSGDRDAWRRVEPGDRVLFYLSGIDAVAGVARVSGERFEADEGASGTDGGPYRFPIEPMAVCEPGEYVPVEPLARDMEHTGGRPPGEWASAFHGTVHEISDADAEILEGAIRLQSGATPSA